MKMFISCVYITPTTCPQLLKKYVKYIKNQLKVNKLSIILGDFNCPECDWNNLIFPNSKKGRIWEKFYYDSQPNFQIVNNPTRENAPLDLIFVNNLEIIDKLKFFPPLNSSDHIVIKALLPIIPSHIKNKKIKDFARTPYFKIEMAIKNQIILI